MTPASGGDAPLHAPRKYRVATVSLAGCFGCHMSFLDIDERLLQLLELVEFDRVDPTETVEAAPAVEAAKPTKGKKAAE